MKGFTRRCALLLAVIAAVAGGFTQGADAINPEQTTERGVVNVLGYNLATGQTQWGSIDKFWAYAFSSWGLSYSRPGILFYNGTYGNYATGCEHTTRWPNNGFYCWGDGRIYLDYPFMQRMLQANGDYYPGAFLAHEWGHRIQHHLGMWYGAQGYRTEYHADCLTGMYTRYGYDTGRLRGTDYREGYNWLYYQPTSPSHGYGPYRAAWYEYGYTQYSLEACNRVFTASATTARRVARLNGVETDRAANGEMAIRPPTGGIVRFARPDRIAPPKGDTSPPATGRSLAPIAKSTS